MKPDPCIAVHVPCGPGQTMVCSVTPATQRCTCRCVNEAVVPTLDWPHLALMGLVLALTAVRRLAR